MSRSHHFYFRKELFFVGPGSTSNPFLKVWAQIGAVGRSRDPVTHRARRRPWLWRVLGSISLLWYNQLFFRHPPLHLGLFIISKGYFYLNTKDPSSERLQKPRIKFHLFLLYQQVATYQGSGQIMFQHYLSERLGCTDRISLEMFFSETCRLNIRRRTFEYLTTLS